MTENLVAVRVECCWYLSWLRTLFKGDDRQCRAGEIEFYSSEGTDISSLEEALEEYGCLFRFAFKIQCGR